MELKLTTNELATINDGGTVEYGNILVSACKDECCNPDTYEEQLVKACNYELGDSPDTYAYLAALLNLVRTGKREMGNVYDNDKLEEVIATRLVADIKTHIELLNTMPDEVVQGLMDKAEKGQFWPFSDLRQTQEEN